MDYEIDYDEHCPKCNRTPVHWRHCNQIGCDDGYIDMHEYDDPLWWDPGEYEICDECNGTGIEKWCPGCGANLSGTLPTTTHPPNKIFNRTAQAPQSTQD